VSDVRNVSAAASAPPPTIWASAWPWLFWALWGVWLAVSDLRNSDVQPVGIPMSYPFNTGSLFLPPLPALLGAAAGRGLRLFSAP